MSIFFFQFLCTPFFRSLTKICPARKGTLNFSLPARAKPFRAIRRSLLNLSRLAESLLLPYNPRIYFFVTSTKFCPTGEVKKNRSAYIHRTPPLFFIFQVLYLFSFVLFHEYPLIFFPIYFLRIHSRFPNIGRSSDFLLLTVFFPYRPKHPLYRDFA